MTEQDLLNYLERNYKKSEKENVYEWAEEALEYMDVKLGMKDLSIMRLEEKLKKLAEAIISAFKENRKVHIEDFNNAADALDSFKQD